MKKYIYILAAVSFLALVSCSKDKPAPDPAKPTPDPAKPVVSKPVAGFDADLTTITAGGTVKFTDTSTNRPTSWEWTFDGGTPPTSTDPNPIVTYATAGTYRVRLIATNAIGSSEPFETANYITVNAVVNPNPDPSRNVLPKSIKTIDNSDNSFTTITFEYESPGSNKIKSITDTYSNTKKVYTYQDDKIIRVLVYDTSNNDKLSSTINLTYNNDNKLASKTYVSDDATTIYRYTYTGKTVTVARITSNNNVENKLSDTTLNLDDRGNVIRVTENDGSSSTYGYDTANNPYKNILGYSSLMRNLDYDTSILVDGSEGSINNQTKYKYESVSNAVDANGQLVTTTDQNGNSVTTKVRKITMDHIYENILDPTTNFLIKRIDKYKINLGEDKDPNSPAYTYEYTY